MIPVLVLFALTFSSVENRRNRVPSMIFAFLVYFGYANLIGFTVALMRRGEIDPALGVWYVHALFLAAAIYVFWRRLNNRPLLPHMKLPAMARRAGSAGHGP